ncbi:hypothetical protein [Promicromonospora sp. NPDC057488]|uniref:hypothetical protein n=1 Tax=Promicromonospora sp. NPDC057488 TaxID=3346147 RepID=UPI00366BD11E
MANDIPGLMAGLSILRMAPIISSFSKRGSNRLTRIAAISLRGNMPERWMHFQMARVAAMAAREAEEGSPRYMRISAGEVAALACLPTFKFTRSRMDDVRNLSLEFWQTCDDLIGASGLEGELGSLDFRPSLESVESGILDRDRVELEAARDPGLEYTAMCNVVVNDYPRRSALAGVIARAGNWGS